MTGKFISPDFSMKTETLDESPAGFTPGPWYVARSGNSQGLVISEATGANVAVTYDPKDAPLVACGPEMVTVLRDCEQSLSRLHDVDGAYRVTVLQMVRSLLAKVEGRT
jgi:hypothetical protein